MHEGAANFIRAAVDILPRLPRVVEFGSRIYNGSIRPLFSRDTSFYWGIDLVSGPGVDQVADARTWGPINLPDCVVCCEVLEHAPDAWQICRNALRILRLGGVFLMTCATEPRLPHGADGGELKEGEYYGNVDKEDLLGWLSDAAVILNNKNEGDLYALAIKR